MKALLLAAMLALLPVMAAWADDSGAQLLTSVPDNIDPNAQHVHLALQRLHNGQTRIYMWGEIVFGDSDWFREALSQVPRPISELEIVGSPGGSLEDGLEIGRIIHHAGLATHIPGFATCASACNFVFLGGIVRTIDVGGKFMVHFFHDSGYPEILVQDSESAAQQYLVNNPPPPGSNQTQTASSTPAAGSSASGKPGSTSPRASIPAGGQPPQTSGAPTANAPPQIKPIPPFQKTSFLQQSDGCMNVYGSDQDLEVQLQEAKLQLPLLAAHEKMQYSEFLTHLGKIAKDNNLPLDQVELAMLQDSPDLEMLRAVTMDFYCMEQSTAQSAAEIAQFLLEMRLSMRFLTEFVSIANARPVVMTRDQLRSYNITNID